MRGAHRERFFEQNVAAFVDARPGEVLLAATSGGPDSAALAALLERAAAERGARLVLGHVNHGLRPSAWQDEAVVLALGSALGARVVCASLAPGSAAEARLRAARYAELARMARRTGARRIFTAHHAEDQTETVLLSLFRGTGPDGLCGMPPSRPLAEGLELVRPLLGFERSALAAYCGQRHLPYALDPSNADAGYRRNALRRALAELRPNFPGLDAAVARCAAILQDEAAETVRSQIRRQLRAGVAGAAGDARDLTFERLEAAARAVEAGRPGRHFLRDGVEVIVAGGRK
jgi:tRNA(Ile)-lysidine synthase